MHSFGATFKHTARMPRLSLIMFKQVPKDGMDLKIFSQTKKRLSASLPAATIVLPKKHNVTMPTLLQKADSLAWQFVFGV